MFDYEVWFSKLDGNTCTKVQSKNKPKISVCKSYYEIKVGYRVFKLS